MNLRNTNFSNLLNYKIKEGICQGHGHIVNHAYHVLDLKNFYRRQFFIKHAYDFIKLKLHEKLKQNRLYGYERLLYQYLSNNNQTTTKDVFEEMQKIFMHLLKEFMNNVIQKFIFSIYIVLQYLCNTINKIEHIV